MKRVGEFPLILLAALFCVAGLLAAAAAEDKDADASLGSAICPVVYRLDESPAAHGYHYSFFGNAFFINEEGYLLTVAHVLETFQNGGQPSILVARPNGPPQLLSLTLIASDTQHDVAILRATPNPFPSHYRVTFLPLASSPVAAGEPVLAVSLHPAHLQSAESFQMPVEDRSAGTVLWFEKTQLEKAAPETEVFLLSHPVMLGQSGSPVLATESRAVIGLVEGRWLRDSVLSLARSADGHADTPGVAIPIRYAISLLDKKGITWHGASHPASSSEQPAKP
jgi:S1-C subfamily serine protease